MGEISFEVNHRILPNKKKFAFIDIFASSCRNLFASLFSFPFSLSIRCYKKIENLSVLLDEFLKSDFLGDMVFVLKDGGFFEYFRKYR